MCQYEARRERMVKPSKSKGIEQSRIKKNDSNCRLSSPLSFLKLFKAKSVISYVFVFFVLIRSVPLAGFLFVWFYAQVIFLTSQDYTLNQFWGLKVLSSPYCNSPLPSCLSSLLFFFDLFCLKSVGSTRVVSCIYVLLFLPFIILSSLPPRFLSASVSFLLSLTHPPFLLCQDTLFYVHSFIHPLSCRCNMYSMFASCGWFSPTLFTSPLSLFLSPNLLFID